MRRPPNHAGISDVSAAPSGGGQRNQPPNGRLRWTEELCDELLVCYESSEPQRRGYMARLLVMWRERHPEMDVTKQNLSDQARAVLGRRGLQPIAQAQSPLPRSQASSTDSVGNLSIYSSEVTAQSVSVASIQSSEIDAEPEPVLVQGRDFEAELREEIAKTTSLRFERRPFLRKPRRKIPSRDLTAMNEALQTCLSPESTLMDVNVAVFAAAKLLLPKRQDGPSAQEKIRGQIAELEEKILEARRGASRIQSVVEFVRSGRPASRKMKILLSSLRTLHKTLRFSVLAVAKQKFLDRIRTLKAIKAKKLSRLQWLEDNDVFLHDTRRFLERERPAPPENPPSADAVRAFWAGIYEESVEFNANSPALLEFESLCRRLQKDQAVCPDVTVELVARTFRGKRNWAAPGVDKIQTFWWKKFTSVHPLLARHYTAMLRGTMEIPAWLVEGRTILIPKGGDLSLPSSYRPITTLNTEYKGFTGCLNELLEDSIQPVWVELHEQKGARRGHEGCKENLLLDRCVCQDAIQHKRNLSVAWVDFRKAFDMTSHGLILRCLEILNVHPDVVRCIRDLMPLWRTRFQCKAGGRVTYTGYVAYQRGVFQGDSLSPKLYCISQLPLSALLRLQDGYMAGPPSCRNHKVTHAFFMDDLKIYGSSKRKLRDSLEVVSSFAADTGMELGVDKCAVLHIRLGKVDGQREDMELVDGSIIRHLGAEARYKYLGVSESHVQDTKLCQKALRGEYVRRLKKIWSSRLSGRNKIQATNMLAIPVMLYTFGAMKWNVAELKALDSITRKVMSSNLSHHKRASVERVYLPRDQGGRGLLGVENIYNRMVLGMACRVATSTDPHLRLVYGHELWGSGAFLFSAAKRAAWALGVQLDLVEPESRPGENLAGLPRALAKQRVREAEVRLLLRGHMAKNMHSVFFKNIESQNLSKERTFAFLRSSGLTSVSESNVIKMQDGVFATLAYQQLIFGRQLDTRCRACNRHVETTMHLLSACPFYARTLYIERHNSALRVLYFHLRHHFGIDDSPIIPYAPGDVEAVVENDQVKIFWNYSWPTTRKLRANKPDIVVLEKRTKALTVVEFSAPAEQNITEKYAEKRDKYRDLIMDLRQSYAGYSVVLVVLLVGVMGGVPDSLVSGLRQVPGCRGSAERLADAMQKAVLLGSLRLLRAHGEVG